MYKCLNCGKKIPDIEAEILNNETIHIIPDDHSTVLLHACDNMDELRSREYFGKRYQGIVSKCF